MQRAPLTSVGAAVGIDPRLPVDSSKHVNEASGKRLGTDPADVRLASISGRRASCRS